MNTGSHVLSILMSSATCCLLGTLCRRTLCDPYLNLFRGIIPPLGGTLDFSPILAFVLLSVSATASCTHTGLLVHFPIPGLCMWRLSANTSSTVSSACGIEFHEPYHKKSWHGVSHPHKTCLWQARDTPPCDAGRHDSIGVLATAAGDAQCAVIKVWMQPRFNLRNTHY